MVFVRILHRVQYNTNDISPAQLLARSLGRGCRSDTGARDQEDTVAKIGEHTRIGDQ